MKFTCDRCDAQYMISDEKVGPNGVKVRCKKCSNVILVRRAAENGAVAAEAPAPAAPAHAGAGLDDELGSAFDHAFGDKPKADAAPGAPKAEAPAGDLDATQGVSPEEAAKLAARSAPPEPAATEWYVAIGQAQVGPLPLSEVRRKWETGDVGPDSLVWRPGMGDWSPLTGVKDLSAYLAAVPRGTPRPKIEPAASPVLSRVAAAAAPAPAPAADVSWKPVGASALAALASEEIAGQGAPAPRPEARAAPAGIKSLVDALPDGGGVDPTGAIPLPIKALQQPTGEQELPRRSGVARGAEQLRQRRSSRALVVGLASGLLVVAGGAAAAVFLVPRFLGGAPKPVAEQAPPPPAPRAEVATAPPPRPAEPTPQQPAAAQPTPAPAPTAAQPAEPAAPAAAAAAAPAPAREEPAPKAEPKPEPKATAKVKEPARPAHEKPVHKAEPAKVAKAEPAEPPPAPSKPTKKKGDVLDFDGDGGNDAALAEALGPAGSKTGRTVYVPPAAGGNALPASVTDSQVQEAIMTRVSNLQQCLADQKARNDAGGVLKMRWNIAPDGSVQNLRCVTPEFEKSPFTSCMSGVLKSVRYPKSQQGRQDVTFPFKF
jgi:predicted Zn finger-like uncharacterized protein